MDDISLDSLLSGDLNGLPKLPKRVVRLFISSTFTDMTLERNSLMERVYPRLKKYCRERHGLDFQVVDMRWGVRDEATDDHQTVNLCSREIENCQRVSLGPNFIALIGDKYGFRPLLNRIKSTEYRSLRRCLIESDINTDFLDTWYKEDLNAVPAEYVLQPISSILKNFTNKSEPELQMVDQRIWQAVQERLHDLLLIGSSRLVKQGRMSEREQALRYSTSVTEREVIEGCLDLDETKSHCLVYVRTIVDLRDQLRDYFEDLTKLSEQHLKLEPTNDTDGVAGNRRDSSQRKASLKIGDDSITLSTGGPQTAAERRLERQRRLIGKYIDLTSKENGSWQIDEEAQQALNNLRETKLKSKLTPGGRNLTLYQVYWNEHDGISVKSEEHKRYLDDLTDHFYRNLTRMIRAAVKNERSKVETRGLIGEVLQHSHYSLQVGKRLLGRSNELQLTRHYILTGSSRPFNSGGRIQAERDQSEPVLPMFLYGVSGSGKTSVLARVSTMALDWIKQSGARRRSSGAAGDLAVYGSPWKQQASGQQARYRWDRAPCIIMRFCCTTPASSSVVGMLTSVCRQLQYNFYQFGPLNGLMDDQARMGNQSLAGRDTSHSNGGAEAIASNKQRATNVTLDQLPFQQIPEDFVRLVYTFRQLLENCRHSLHRRRTFVIIIDSIERLSAPAECGVEAKFSWLTNLTKLPPNVRLIVSCSSSGSTESELADYLHLKRHFLRVHLRHASGELLRDEGRRSSASIGVSGSSSEQSLSESNSSNNESNESVSELKERADSKFKLLKRLILPVARLARGSRGLVFGPAGADMAQLQRPTQVRFSKPKARVVSSRSGSDIELKRASSNESLQSGEHRPSSKTPSLPSSGLVHIRPLGRELGQAVLRRWLAESGRNLSHPQWAIVDRSLAHCSRPIFVKLAFGEVINWKSYSMRGDARGLTFGSAWLGDFKPGGERGTGCSALAELVCRRDEATARSAEEELKFKWQTLAMEQQWLNYLDYTAANERTKSSDNTNRTNSNAAGDLVIRIGAASGQTGGGLHVTASGSSSKSSTAVLSSTSSASSSSGATGGSASICHLSDTIEDAICQLFARIELKHGYLLTKHSLSYITAARNGICENELEDILSLDDVVLDDVFQYHLPPVRRIPPLLWTRIRNDLPDYLSERDADGIVLTWHHGQFKAVTEKRYMSSARQLTYVHSLMADYFLGKWADKAKPFRCTKQQVQMAAEQLESAIQKSMRRDSDQSANPHVMRQSGQTSGANNRVGAGRLGSGSTNVRSGASFSLRNRLRSSDQHDQRLQWMQAKAHRRVPHQPLYYETSGPGSQLARSASQEAEAEKSPAGAQQQIAVDSDSKMATDDDHDQVSSPAGGGARRYNLRKLTELPYHLLRSGRFLELASHVLFNYHWLFATIDALGLQSLFADLNEAVSYLEKELASKRHTRMDVEGNVDEMADLGEADLTDTTGGELAVASRDNLTAAALGSLTSQLITLVSTLRLSASVIHANPRQLAPQLIGRLLQPTTDEPLQTNQDDVRALPQPASEVDQSARWAFLEQLLSQCDSDGCTDCALLPIAHCLQSADGLQLSSLEGHPFGVMSMCLASDQRHLLAVSTKFLMWNISTGEVARDVEPKLNGAIIKRLLLSSSNKFALAHTSDNRILSLEISTQEVSSASLDDLIRSAEAADVSDDSNSRSEERAIEPSVDQIEGMKLIDERDAKRSLVWLQSGRIVVLKLEEADQAEAGAHPQQPSSHHRGNTRISLHYKVDYPSLNLTTGCDGIEPPMRVLEVAIEQATRNWDLLLVMTAGSSDCKTMQLDTLRVNLESARRNGPQTLQAWSPLKARLIALGPSLSQTLVVGQFEDEILLRRLRATRWSQGKRLCRVHKDESSARSLLAIELESGDNAVDGEHQTEWSELRNADTSGGSSLHSRLVEFERELDGACEEIQPLNVAYAAKDTAGKGNTSLKRGRPVGSTNEKRARFAKLNYTDRIVVLQLDKPQPSESKDSKMVEFAYQRYCLMLPRDTRNVSLDLNVGQLSSKIVPVKDETAQVRQHYLIVVAARRLLVFSLEGQQLLKCIEAHSSRITSLWPIQSLLTSRDARSGSSTRGSTGSHLNALCVATSSMDRTVKIWNLANLNKDGQAVPRLAITSGGRQFESISLNSQRPLACCLSRGQLSLWDWQRAKLLACYDTLEELTANVDKHQANGSTETADEATTTSGIVKICKFSRNGRYLALASNSTLDQEQSTISLMAVEGNSQADVARRAANPTEVKLRLWASKTLAKRGSARKLKFLAQDSRLIVITTTSTCNARNATGQHNSTSTESSSTETEQTNETDKTQARQDSRPTSLASCDRLHITALTVPELRSMYSIEGLTPSQQASSSSSPGAKQQDLLRNVAVSAGQPEGRTDSGSQSKNLLAAITCDHHLLVVVAPRTSRNQLEVQERSNALATDQAQSALVLDVYTARDGQLVKSVDLSQLQIAPQPKTEVPASESRSSDSQAARVRGTFLEADHGGKGAARSQNQKLALDGRQQRNSFVSIRAGQFSRVQAVNNRDRQSIVALMNDETGASWLIDVSTRMLVAQTSSWSGRLSHDGRYGLSRMFASSQAAGNTDATSPLSTAGLMLLEMRHCRPIRSLLSLSQFDSLLNSGQRSAGNDMGGGSRPTRRGPQSGAFTSQSGVLCGFSKPNDDYVYVSEPRSRRLMLLRVRDSQLLANYRLPAEPSRIKSSPDGMALIAGLNDGTLLAVAIVDPMSGETIARLAQYPSRRLRRGRRGAA